MPQRFDCNGRTWTPRLWGLALLVFALSVGTFASLGPSEAIATKVQKPATKSTTPPAGFYALGPCDASDIGVILGSSGPFKNAPVHATALINARIAACASIISFFQTASAAQTPAPPVVIANSVLSPIPTAPPTPSPPSQCTGKGSDAINEPTRAYAILFSCQSWIARYVSSPAPSSTLTPQPLVFRTPKPTDSSAIWKKTVYVLALASDAPTSTQLAHKLARELQDPQYRKPQTDDLYVNAPVRKVEYQVLAEPLWTIANYQQQCFSDSSTAGAIVILPPSTQTASWNLLLAASWTAVGIQAMVLDCEPMNTSYVYNQSYVTWISEIDTATGRRYSLSLATALSGLAAYQALNPARNYSVAIVTPSPLPTSGSSYPTGYTTNAQTANGFIAAAGVAALTPLSSTNIGQGVGTTPDATTAAAIAQAVKILLPQLARSCSNYQRTGLSATQCDWFQLPPK